MFQKFTVDKFLLHANSEEIVLTFTLDIDDETVNSSTIYITESKSGLQPILMSSENNFDVDGRVVKLHYKNLEVNTPYEIHVTHGIHSIIGDELEVEFVKQFELASSIDSIIEILSPADYENVDTLNLRIKETAGASKKLFNSFQVQVSSDVNFLDVILDTNLDGKSEAEFSDLKQEKQYFLRVRAYDGESFGNWSAPVTFTRVKKTDAPPNGGAPKDTEDDDWIPDVIEDMELVAMPENGVTPHSFIFEFDSELDGDKLKKSDIILTVRKV